MAIHVALPPLGWENCSTEELNALPSGDLMSLEERLTTGAGESCPHHPAHLASCSVTCQKVLMQKTSRPL